MRTALNSYSLVTACSLFCSLQLCPTTTDATSLAHSQKPWVELLLQRKVEQMAAPCDCAGMCMCLHAHMCKWVRQRRQISTQTTVAKCIMHQNNESHLCLLTFRGCCLHFAALCINTHGFNNLGSGVVIDPVGHSPPFLISSRAWSFAVPRCLRIYILQNNHVCRGQWPQASPCLPGSTSADGNSGVTCV